MKLTTSLERIKGVGPKTAERLHAAGLVTVRDLINFYPRRYEDYSEVVAISDITPGKRTIKARVESTEVKRVRRGMTITNATLADDTGKLRATWFNQPYRATQFKDGEEYFFSGEFEFRYNRYQLTNPSAERASDMPVQTDRVLPIYRQIRGLKSQSVRKIISEIRPLIAMLDESIPSDIIAQQKLVSRSEALLGLHFPQSLQDVAAARERLGFEEMFALMIASQLNRRDNDQMRAVTIPFNQPVVRNFVAKLPFQLTDAQRRAAWEIIQDLERDVPMNRLLQGDVGSGKTVVAGIAALSSAQAGYQTAIMAPTEVLARQHAETLQRLLAPFDVSVGLLVGQVKGKAREELYSQIASGEVDVIIGTQALIQDAVIYHRLGLAVIDEQHRFGVAQRQKLLGKSSESRVMTDTGQPAATAEDFAKGVTADAQRELPHITMPHLLTMTATPIPRSLQLTMFGDLDSSILNQLPASRKPIKTQIVSPVSTAKVYAAIDAEIAAGRQAYVICPLIDDTADSDKKSVEAEHKKLQNSVFGHRSIGLLHGRMKSTEKEQVMRDFAAKKYDILVSTTVVEVGVDVPNVSVILIENADQYGLAQLHQLRGRVGRGEQQSYCYLMMSDTSQPSRRLREIERSNDGFYLAEVDLELRGPGEIYGRMQHGELNLQVAKISDTKLAKRAQGAAAKFLASSGKLAEYPGLAREVDRYRHLTTLN